MEYYSTLRKKNPAMSTNMVGSRRHYIKGNKPDTEKTNASLYHLYVKSQIVISF